jgi:hypothetical protein
MEQIDAELQLQLSHLLAERGLGEVQAFCRTSKVQLFSDRDEVSKPTKLHSILLWRRAPSGMREYSGCSPGTR